MGAEYKYDDYSNLSGKDLTPREIEILQLVALGLTSKEIGKICGIRESSVKNKLGIINKKLNTTDRVQAAKIALDNNLIEINPSPDELNNLQTLTKRERQVIESKGKGQDSTPTYRLVAKNMNVSPKTVRGHHTNIRNRAEKQTGTRPQTNRLALVFYSLTHPKK